MTDIAGSGRCGYQSDLQLVQRHRGYDRKIEAGELGGTAYKLTFKNDGLRLEFNESIEIDDEVKQAARAAIEDIKNGVVDPVLLEEDDD